MRHLLHSQWMSSLEMSTILLQSSPIVYNNQSINNVLPYVLHQTKNQSIKQSKHNNLQSDVQLIEPNKRLATAYCYIYDIKSKGNHQQQRVEWIALQMLLTCKVVTSWCCASVRFIVVSSVSLPMPWSGRNTIATPPRSAAYGCCWWYQRPETYQQSVGLKWGRRHRGMRDDGLPWSETCMELKYREDPRLHPWWEKHVLVVCHRFGGLEVELLHKNVRQEQWGCSKGW